MFIAKAIHMNLLKLGARHSICSNLLSPGIELVIPAPALERVNVFARNTVHRGYMKYINRARSIRALLSEENPANPETANGWRHLKRADDARIPINVNNDNGGGNVLPLSCIFGGEKYFSLFCTFSRKNGALIDGAAEMLCNDQDQRTNDVDQPKKSQAESYNRKPQKD